MPFFFSQSEILALAPKQPVTQLHRIQDGPFLRLVRKPLPPQKLRHLGIVVIGGLVKISGKLGPGSYPAVPGPLPQIGGIGFIVLRQKWFLEPV